MSDRILVQETLSEELALLPGKISRCFFFLATLDAQSKQLEHDLNICRQQAIKILNSADDNVSDFLLGSEAANLSQKIKTHDFSGFNKQFKAIQQLQEAQRELIVNKLVIEKKTSDWFKQAQNSVLKCHQEIRRSTQQMNQSTHSMSCLRSKFKHSQNPSNLNNSDNDSSLQQYFHPIFERRLHQKQNKSRQTMMSSNSAQLNSVSQQPFSDSSNFHSQVFSTKKRRMTSSTASNLCYEKSLLQTHKSSSNVRKTQDYTTLSSGTVTSSFVPNPDNIIPSQIDNTVDQSSIKPSRLTEPREGMIIKLGSQKGRPRKSSSRHGTGSTGVSDQYTNFASTFVDTLDTTVTEEYICLICKKSENDNPAMVACDNCDRWYHCVCVGFVDEADAADKTFYCPNCSEIAKSDTDL